MFTIRVMRLISTARDAGSFGLSGVFVLSAFEMGHTPARAARPLVGVDCEGIGPCPSALLAALHEILATAFGVVVFSVIVQGLTMPLLMRKRNFYDGDESIRRQP
jgi:NhaP-type Na+/H+ or K+/H+ antiporter